MTLLASASGAAESGGPAGKRARVAVMDFDYGTISDRWWGDLDIGRGLADQVVDALVNDGSVVVVERKRLDTILAEQDFASTDRANPDAASLARLGKVAGLRYIVAGSITKFGTSRKDYSAGKAAAALGPIGMFGLKKAKTEVGVTVRVIDTSSGEVVLSVTGEGISKKGGGLSLSGIGKLGGGASFSMASDDYKASAIGEAQEKACQQLLENLLPKVGALVP
jgi:curli biogenesis system outer membrane secretion channel CsgG